MPALAALPVKDLNGNGVIDENDAEIVETGFNITVGGMGVLQVAAPYFLGGGLVSGLDDVLDAIDALSHLLAPDTGDDIMEKLDSIALDAALAAGAVITPDGSVQVKLDTILDNIAALELEWPPDAPVWYEPPPAMILATDIAAAVWNKESAAAFYNGSPGYLSRGEVVDSTYFRSAFDMGFVGVRVPNNPYFLLVCDDPNGFQPPAWSWAEIENIPPPAVPDWSAVLEDDTPVSFLQREQPLFGWDTDGPWGTPSTDIAWAHISAGGRSYWWRSAFTRHELQRWHFEVAVEQGDIVIQATSATVWPGLANVTLGDAVPLTDGILVAGPLDGVLIQITGAPANASKWGFGDVLSYKFVGAVMFQTDGGEYEFAQNIGAESMILVPKTMRRAANALFRFDERFTGTVQPWTITDA